MSHPRRGGARGRATARQTGLCAFPAAILMLAACAGGGTAPGAASRPTASATASASASSAPATGTITLYTSVQQTTVDPVLAAFAEAAPGVTVELFRAPTGELSARIAADIRDQGRIGGDVLWLSDPLSAASYHERGLLHAFEPANAADIDPAYVSGTFWGTRVLNMVIVAGADVDPVPTGWEDLAEPAFEGAVAIPNPAFAGTAFGALGYFANAPEFGLDYYRRLKDNGSVQVNAPDEVTTGVAEGRFKAGMTLDFSARSAVQKGSPVRLVWPDPGAIAIHGPIAVVDASENLGAAKAFVEFALSPEGQAAIAEAGWEPVRDGVGGPAPGGEQVRPDWADAYGRQQELLDAYAEIFGG